MDGKIKKAWSDIFADIIRYRVDSDDIAVLIEDQNEELYDYYFSQRPMKDVMDEVYIIDAIWNDFEEVFSELFNAGE